MDRKAFKRLQRSAVEQGWRVELRGSGHLAWKPPTGQMIITASTPGGANRSIDNAVSMLKKAGLKV